MCLKRIGGLRIAGKGGVICYKIVKTRDRKLRTYLLHKLKRLSKYDTYFRDTPITIGEEVEGYPILTKKDVRRMARLYSIDGGFIHSYKKIPRVPLDRWDTVIECIIPEGTMYYEGLHGFHFGYASTHLKYVRRIK